MQRHTLSLLILLLVTLLFPWNFGYQVKSIPIPVFSHIPSARTTHRKQFHCYVAQITQKTSHVVTISPVDWLADCCLATSYKHSSSCCVSVSRGIYRAVAWQCVDMSQYLWYCNDIWMGRDISQARTDTEFSSILVSRNWWDTSG
jgi:hypothetical protein